MKYKFGKKKLSFLKKTHLFRNNMLPIITKAAFVSKIFFFLSAVVVVAVVVVAVVVVVVVE